jgi:hypothetical protein
VNNARASPLSQLTWSEIIGFGAGTLQVRDDTAYDFPLSIGFLIRWHPQIPIHTEVAYVPHWLVLRSQTALAHAVKTGVVAPWSQARFGAGAFSDISLGLSMPYVDLGYSFFRAEFCGLPGAWRATLGFEFVLDEL